MNRFPRRRSGKPHRRRPQLESLENRDVPAFLATAAYHYIVVEAVGNRGEASNERLLLIPGETSRSIAVAIGDEPSRANSTSSFDWVQNRLPNSSQGWFEARGETFSEWPEEEGVPWRTSARGFAGMSAYMGVSNHILMQIHPDVGENYGDLVQITLDARYTVQGANVADYLVGYWHPERGQIGTLIKGEGQTEDATSETRVIYAHVGDVFGLRFILNGGQRYWSDAIKTEGSRSLTLDYKISTAQAPILGDHPLYLDLGDDGLWSWNEGAQMQRLGPGGAWGLAVAGNGTLYINYGFDSPNWNWDGKSVRRLVSWSPDRGFFAMDGFQGENIAASPDGSIYLDKNLAGTVKFTKDGGPRGINEADPQAMVVGSDGLVFLDYGPHGLWRGDEWGIKLVNAADPQSMTAGPDGSLFVDYGAFGLWKWTENVGMVQINAADPQSMTAGRDGSLFVDYGTFGLWKWTENVGMVQINAADPLSMTVATDGSLFVSYEAHGLWRWTASAGMTWITPVAPEAAAVTGDGWTYFDMGAAGIWRWSNVTFLVKFLDFNPLHLAAIG